MARRRHSVGLRNKKKTNVCSIFNTELNNIQAAGSAFIGLLEEISTRSLKRNERNLISTTLWHCNHIEVLLIYSRSSGDGGADATWKYCIYKIRECFHLYYSRPMNKNICDDVDTRREAFIINLCTTWKLISSDDIIIYIWMFLYTNTTSVSVLG